MQGRARGVFWWLATAATVTCGGQCAIKVFISWLSLVTEFGISDFLRHCFAAARYPQRRALLSTSTHVAYTPLVRKYIFPILATDSDVAKQLRRSTRRDLLQAKSAMLYCPFHRFACDNAMIVAQSLSRVWFDGSCW